LARENGFIPGYVQQRMLDKFLSEQEANAFHDDSGHQTFCSRVGVI